MDLSWLVPRLISFAVLLPAIVFHEVAHGYAALALGDTTAKNAGRLTLNPIKHIDLWGTIILPALMIFAFGVGFGYAKPVPVNPYRFKDYRMGMFLTGVAGPAANLVLAFVSGIVFRVAASGLLGLGQVALVVALAAEAFAAMNLMLLFFNLIPIPPLDGSRVLPLFLSDSAMRSYHQVERYGFMILFGFLYLAPRILGFDPIDVYFSYTLDPLLMLFTGMGR